MITRCDEQLVVAIRFDLRVRVVRAVAREHGDRLIVRVLIRARIDVEERLSDADFLAFLEIDRHE